MICRIWHGWTEPANADAYEDLLQREVFAGIAARGIAGYRGIQLLRRPAGGEVEFVTLMWFDTLADVERFAGAEYDRAVVPAAARALLARFEERSAHYEVRQGGADTCGRAARGVEREGGDGSAGVSGPDDR